MSSSTTRLTHADANVVAQHLTRLWSLGKDCTWCGSLRRGKPDVGDLDLVAPLPTGDRDPLFETIDACMEKQGALFGSAKPMGIPLKGHKTHFKTAYYELTTKWQMPDGSPVRVGLNVFRYQPGNRGWTEIRVTGPEQFGIMFLAKWKDQFGIRKEAEASIEGHLVDNLGVAIPATTEAEAFQLAGWKKFIEPQDRDRVAAGWANSSSPRGHSRKDFPS